MAEVIKTIGRIINLAESQIECLKTLINMEKDLDYLASYTEDLANEYRTLAKYQRLLTTYSAK